uniref:Dynein heavy chain tail domain-containing protein n=1 Tax=Eptatretus burgeri TaxID=7764 RepID=A0A8C4QI34_EPTBU
MLKDDNRHDGVLNGVETLENNDTSTLSNKPHSNKQLQGGVHLELPNVDITWDDDQLPREENIQQEVKRAMLEWRKLITNTLETQLGKQAQGAGPLAVVELWRERSMVLRTLVEQLQEPRVKRVSKLAGQLDPESLHGFEVVTVQLETAREDATDNFHLLSTLDRHFKKLAQGRDFGAIAETLPRLLEGLHLVWNISMHYKRGDHMEALMERIAWQVCESARHAVNMCTLFRDDGEER